MPLIQSLPAEYTCWNPCSVQFSSQLWRREVSPKYPGGKRWHLDARERLLFAFPIAGKLSPRLPSGILCANGPQTPRKSDYIHYKGVSAISASCLSDPIFKRIPKVMDEQNQVNEGVWSQFRWYLSWPTAKRTSSRYSCLSSKARHLGPIIDHILRRYGVVECTSQWNPRLTGREALARTHMWDCRFQPPMVLFTRLAYLSSKIHKCRTHQHPRAHPLQQWGMQ